MKRITTLIALFWALALQAQNLQSYGLSVENSTWQSIASTGTRLNMVYYANSQVIQLPFDLEFGEHSIYQGSNVKITGRGTLILGNYGPWSYAYTSWNDPSQEYVVIPFFMGQAEAPNQSTSRVYWLVRNDDRGGQELVVEWTGMHRTSHNGESVDFQVHLHSNGDIGVLYGPATVTSEADSLFTFAAVAGSTTDRVLITGNWNTDSSIMKANPTNVSLYPLTPLMSGVPAQGLLLTYTRPVSACPHPTNLTVTDVSQDEITIAWTGNGVAGGQYIVQYDTVDFTPGSGWHPSATVTDTFFNANLLLQNQHYWFKVRSNCGTDTSAWEGIDGWTSCNEMTHADLPYSWQFETTTAPCWRKFGQVTWRSQSGSGANIVHFCNIFGSESFAIMPPMDWVNDLQVSFRVKSGPVMVGVMDNPYDTSTFTPVHECWANNADWYTYTVRLSPYNGTGKYIAFHSWPNQYGVAGGCWLDDVVLETIQGCIAPEHLVVNRFNATSADISWRDYDSVGAYRVVYYADGVAPDTVITSVDHCTLTSLLPETYYTVMVNILCDSATVSPADTVHFTTLATCIMPVAVTVGNISGRSATVHWTEMNSIGTYLVTLTKNFNRDTISVDTVVGDTIVYYNDLEANTGYHVYVSQLCSGTWTDQAWESFRTVYSCAGPQQLSVDSIVGTSAMITITDSLPSSNYALVIHTGAQNDTIYTSNTAITITGLNLASSYELTAYTVCSDTSFSDGVSVQFSTPCSSITHADIPYVEDFNHCVHSDLTSLSPCWTYSNFAPSNYVGLYRPDGTVFHGATGLSLYASVRSDRQPMFIVLPEVDSTSDLVLSYWVNSPLFFPAKVEVGIMTNPTDTATFTSLHTYILPESNQWLEQEVSLENHSGTGRYVAFRIGSADSSMPAYIYLDDIQLRFPLSCDQPDSLYITDLTDSSATLVIVPSVESDSDAAAYQVIISSAYSTDTVMSTTTTLPLVGLISATDYEVSVRSLCPEGGFTLATSMQFCSPCGAYRLPYYEDFEAHDLFHLPRCWELADTLSMEPEVRATNPAPYSGLKELLVTLRDSTQFASFATPMMAPCDRPTKFSFMVRMFDIVGWSDTSVAHLKVSLMHGYGDTLLYSAKTIFSEWTLVEIPVEEGLLAEGGRFVFDFSHVTDDSIAFAYLHIDDVILMADTTTGPVESIDQTLSLHSQSLVVTPNPASRLAYVTREGMQGHWTLRIYDAMGREVSVAAADGPSVCVDISRLPAGGYFLRADGAPGVARLLVVRR